MGSKVMTSTDDLDDVMQIIHNDMEFTANEPLANYLMSPDVPTNIANNWMASTDLPVDVMNFLCGDEPMSYDTGDHVAPVYVSRDDVKQELEYGINMPLYTELTSAFQRVAKKHEFFNVTSNHLMAGGCASLKTDHVTSGDPCHCERAVEGATTETVNTDHVAFSSDILTCMDPQSSDEISPNRSCGNGDVINDVHYQRISQMTSETRTIIEKQLLDNNTPSESAHSWSAMAKPCSGSTTKNNMTSSNCYKYTYKSRQCERFVSRIKPITAPQFLLNLLEDSRYNPEIIYWVDRDSGTFRLAKSKSVARMWAITRKQMGWRRTSSSYEHFSRTIRHHYKRGEILAQNARLTYKFGPQGPYQLSK